MNKRKRKYIPLKYGAPKLAKEWHPTKNGKLNPENISRFSKKKVWWKCTKDKTHIWKTVLVSRYKHKSRCPFCVGVKTTTNQTLFVKFPNIARDWHPTKNRKLNPKNTYAYSTKRVWWKCVKKNHVYKKSVDNHVLNGCTHCQRLDVINPNLAKEWHPIKNGKRKPSDFKPMSRFLIWWQCPKEKSHVYTSRISHRSNKHGCPYCVNQRISDTNNLLVTHPHIAKEWHPTKNGNLRSDKITAGTSKRFWWQCPKKKEHIWKATVHSRTGLKTNCPLCKFQSSSIEIRIYSELKKIFKRNIFWQDREFGVQTDVYIKSINLCIEIDGAYWHKNSVAKDKRKNKFLSKKGIKVIRLREQPLKKISKTDINFFWKEDHFEVIKKLLKGILNYSKVYKKQINHYLNKGRIQNIKLYNRIYSSLPGTIYEKSLKKKAPNLAKEWHPTKNGNLGPEDVSPGSNRKVWWKCKKKGHVWLTNINDRFKNYKSKSRGCPYCDNKKVDSKNNFLYLYPKMAKEWHPTKNGKIKPQHLVPGSNKKIWWRCTKDTKHVWRANPNTRTQRSTGCLQCYFKSIKNIPSASPVRYRHH